LQVYCTTQDDSGDSKIWSNESRFLYETMAGTF
jgi:hypothetical protein